MKRMGQGFTKWGKALPNKSVPKEQHLNKQRIVSKPRDKISHPRFGPNFAELELSKDITELWQILEDVLFKSILPRI